MCLIILQPPGEPIPADAFKNAWERNHDGAGYMFCADGKLVIRKPFFTLKSLRKAYRRDHSAHGALSPFVIHFRFATHGKNDEVNTHPHAVNSEVGLVHNGILDDFEPPYRSALSDTAWFVRTVLIHRNPGDLVGETLRDILADMIGEGNKFVLLRQTGEYSIVNESSGVWDGGVWYSNSGYKALAPIKCTWTPSYRMLPVHYQPTRDKVFSWGDCGGGYDDPWANLERDSRMADLRALEEELDLFPDGPLDNASKAEYLDLVDRIQKLEAEIDAVGL